MTQEIIKFDIAEATIQKWNDDFMQLTVSGIDDKQGYDTVYEARQIIKTARVSVEKTRKELKKEALEYGKKVDGEAKSITAKLLPIEEHLMQQQRIVDDEKKRIKEEAEKARLEIIEMRQKMLLELGAHFNMTSFVLGDCEIDNLSVKTADDDGWVGYMGAMTNAKLANDKLEAERVEVERIEKAKLEAERVEVEKQRAELAEQQAKLQAEKDKIEAEKEAVEALEAKKQREAEAKKQAEGKAKIAQERAEALKPDVDKLNSLADAMEALTSSIELTTNNGKLILSEIDDTLCLVAKSLRKRIK